MRNEWTILCFDSEWKISVLTAAFIHVMEDAYESIWIQMCWLREQNEMQWKWYRGSAHMYDKTAVLHSFFLSIFTHYNSFVVWLWRMSELWIVGVWHAWAALHPFSLQQTIGKAIIFGVCDECGSAMVATSTITYACIHIWVLWRECVFVCVTARCRCACVLKF